MPRDVGGESLEKLLLVLAWVKAAGLAAHLEPTVRPQQLFVATLCLHTPAGQLTWLITRAQLPLVAHLPRAPRSHFDGATATKKLERLLALTGQPFASQEASMAILDGLKGPSVMGPEAVAGWQDRAVEHLAPKRPGRYDVFLAPNGADMRVERTRGPRGLKNLPKDRAQRQIHPVDGWIYAGTLTKP